MLIISGRNEIYEVLFTSVMRSSSPPITVCLQHYADGPILWIQCSQFTATHKNQVNVLRQDQSGWHYTETTAYCLTGEQIDIASYIQQCKHFSLHEACRSRNPISFFFEATGPYTNVEIIQQCIELYTTLRLLRRAWNFAGNETLGMDTIEQEGSAWRGIRPVPRMIQNQLGHLLELHMITLDKKILKGIQAMLRDRKQWAVTTIALAILLHTRELDIGRNLYWSRYADPAGFWIHPSKPKALVEEATVSCNSLLSHYRCTWGLRPLHLDWTLQKSKDMVGNEERAVKFIQKLQKYVQSLEKNGWIGQEVGNLYRDGDPDSVGFTISSLLFKKDCYEAKGVC
ncbi:hypothetical protein PMIN01_11761 [Paraphaeosphaeria minitans]|uniref:Uncharacterized protein n=1 Tax=Paraphaeosphaeria minitans TaxID=565426 RepID=A0A9P6G6X9_9PLEO|nr:hypothetical protein PMIN01_11761 [Paraphaeosphaeria minitans]